MILFPTKIYVVKLEESVDVFLSKLELDTYESDGLFSQFTEKKFIGKIKRNSFKIVGSEVGIGAFTVFLGIFDNNEGTITTRVNKAFKLLISIMYLLPIISVVWAFIDNGFFNSFGLIIPLLMSFLFIRFIITGLFYKISFNLTAQKLKTSFGLKLTN